MLKVKEILPNGDVVVDGTNLYRVQTSSRVLGELETASDVATALDAYNCGNPVMPAVAVAYKDMQPGKLL